MKRVPFVAANGLVVLVQSALFLAHRARVEAFDMSFYIVQIIELRQALQISHCSVSTCAMVSDEKARFRGRSAPAPG